MCCFTTGVFCILDDICAQLHAQTEGADEKFLQKCNNQVKHHEHYQGGSECFIVHHYAGQVMNLSVRSSWCC